MVTSKSEQSGEYVNGRNGVSAHLELDPEPVEDSSLVRRAIALLVLTGNSSDGQTLYFSIPGATTEGWAYLERSAAPLRSYVIDGDPTYLRPLSNPEYQPVKTPEGDCAEDALPLESRNPYRAAAKKKNPDS